MWITLNISLAKIQDLRRDSLFHFKLETTYTLFDKYYPIDLHCSMLIWIRKRHSLSSRFDCIQTYDILISKLCTFVLNCLNDMNSILFNGKRSSCILSTFVVSKGWFEVWDIFNIYNEYDCVLVGCYFDKTL